MLVVETVARIRREFFVRGKSIKEIVRDLGVSRNTVRKVLRSGETAFAYERNVQPLPKLGPWAADLDRLLEANDRKARRERLTMIRIFEELQGLGYRGGYDAVRRYAAGWHRDRSAAMSAAFVPLSFAPGEAYQFDWSHEIVVIAGVTTTVKVAHLRLCHSRMFYVRAYPRESQEMVFDAHDRAFAFLGGACQRGIYDNMKTAVDAIFVGRERRYNRRFEQMCGHYLVEPVACTPASGWETHLAIAIGRACVRTGARVRFYNTVDLVNRLEAETRAGKPGRADNRKVAQIAFKPDWTKHAKPRLLGISKRGNTYLRTLLIHGARAALPSLSQGDTPLGHWLKAMIERGVHRNAVVVALANKLARIAWAALRKETSFERSYPVAA